MAGPDDDKPGTRGERAASAATADGLREGLGYSSEFIVPRMQVRDREDDGEDYAGYRDEVEQATLMIIRAKGQEEPASSVLRDRAAKEQTEATGEPESSADTPNKRALHCLFLCAWPAISCRRGGRRRVIDPWCYRATHC